ncbi:MAG: cupin domain-containing protein, partial [Desulfovibrionales bacterium]|nr:cupin domain-containing protein [Desulfovibrionales bacterium]
MRHLYFIALVLIISTQVWADDLDPNVQVLARTNHTWDEQLLPQYPQGQPEVTILEITIPAGAKLPLHMHPVINAGVLIQGELTVTTEHNEVQVLKAGEAIVEVVDKWHYGQNKGPE